MDPPPLKGSQRGPGTRASAIGTREAHMELLEPPGTPEEPLELLEGLMEQSRRLS